MEAVASYVLLFLVYFLGTLSLVQEVIRPRIIPVKIPGKNVKTFVTNYAKIIFLSFGISIITSTLAYKLLL
ncbi:MAG TPA: hypothetical protein DEQ87_10520 [Algoriphagus sp.]|jgi:hypothetical protein|uniref:Uncharacterized protein n=1 Tax=Algoriphagus ornithinivorans TaxID=226506 RepID=A0A1I5JZL5_9BACT|nr:MULTISPECIES: hypothetical protein [Algoriphagus]MAL14900.1 hypothetical protein [Algoriphagus sp.]QYH37599.1 hypothetical protein GYM62_01805 [Algoriphagus sp. NBT04N3]SFO77831.1 hypothetical protein SAMN04488519_11461 [Algoriphagus ornithinivorans]HAD51701.1 hypothetical protein [Algoriphagus sp.]HAH37669.1 hypothetical protein [Algoriphagus sp.]